MVNGFIYSHLTTMADTNERRMYLIVTYHGDQHAYSFVNLHGGAASQCLSSYCSFNSNETMINSIHFFGGFFGGRLYYFYD